MTPLIWTICNWQELRGRMQVGGFQRLGGRKNEETLLDGKGVSYEVLERFWHSWRWFYYPLNRTFLVFQGLLEDNNR